MLSLIRVLTRPSFCRNLESMVSLKDGRFESTDVRADLCFSDVVTEGTISNFLLLTKAADEPKGPWRLPTNCLRTWIAWPLTGERIRDLVTMIRDPRGLEDFNGENLFSIILELAGLFGDLEMAVLGLEEPEDEPVFLRGWYL